MLLTAASLALVFIEKTWLRYFAAVLLVTQAMALLLTYTRGSWLALAFGLAVGVMMIDSRLIWPFVAGGGALIPFVPGALDRVLSIFSLAGTASYRLTLWKVAGVAISERPLFGVGLGRFYDAFTNVVLNHPELNMTVLVYGAHQSYFQLAAEVGVIGAIAFAWMVFEACRMGGFYTVRMRGDIRARLANSALAAGLIAFAINALTSNAFQHPRGAVFFFVLVGMQAALGAPFWSLPAEETLRAGADRQSIWSRSLPGRAYSAVERAVSAAWQSSVTRRLILSRPAGAGELLADSALARAVVGDGSQSSQRVSGAAE
ncbi:O-antigen ligase domain-containing protein [bacterium]|nr:O-antigen ligase domain-containing protein [bacterium]